MHRSEGGDNGHPSYSCETCHPATFTLLDAGHMFDSTPGRAEADLSGGLSSASQWEQNLQSCANSYCHGNGLGDNGEIKVSDGARDCASCHPSGDKLDLNWLAMSGDHAKHLWEGLECGDCHASVASGNAEIHEPTLHVNGSVEVQTNEAGFEISEELRCTGSCHGENHNNQGW